MAAAVLFDALDWLDDPQPHPPALNMAIDEALFEALGTGGQEARPLLRTYRWEGPAVSIGYFEQMAEARKLFPGIPIVRRWTGGGMVEHGKDLTYSLLVPRGLIPPSWQGAAGYEAIHARVADALQACGLDGVVLSGAAATQPSAECFRRPVDHDVLFQGRKIAGAAQRRTRLGLLHQGSIQAAFPSFEPGGALHRTLVGKLPDFFAHRWQPRALIEPETSSALRLCSERYASAGWLEKF